MVRNLKEKVMEIVFLAAALASIVAVALICIFLFQSGLPAMKEIGFADFLFGTEWRPGNKLFGIFPMIVGSLYVTAGAILIGVPIGLFMAVYLAMYCPDKVYKVLKPAVDLLAGIPSIVYGFFGMVVIVPAVRFFFNEVIDLNGKGDSILTASIVLGIMILPTIIGAAEPAIRAVPKMYYEGALALGADHERSTFAVVFPAAQSGILASIILGIGRAVGETMAVVMIAGNQPRMPQSILKGVRTMTANIVLEMGYATDLHREALIATGVVLFIFILLINLSFSALKRKGKH